eukprot:gb/GECG01012152.1/.p1 GENE.gb/GECG01012152.1/~~gb/GECG01012152.1/.p1  ORF type:complete len:231 (+),score=37.90 gb/GECG01012152.1/:1-693(+)
MATTVEETNVAEYFGFVFPRNLITNDQKRRELPQRLTALINEETEERQREEELSREAHQRQMAAEGKSDDQTARIEDGLRKIEISRKKTKGKLKEEQFEEDVDEDQLQLSDIFYVHIDTREEHGEKPGPIINEFMLRYGYYDPRRNGAFLDDLFEESEGPLEMVSLNALRDTGEYSQSYYELWRVRSNFSPTKLQRWMRLWDARCITTVTKIIDNEHEMVRFPVRQAPSL